MYHPDGGVSDTARLEDYLRAIRLRKWVVVGVTVAGVLAALMFSSSRVENYEAVSRVALYPTPVGSVDNRLVTPNLEKEKEILASNEIAVRVKEVTQSPETPAGLLSGLSVKFVPKSDVLVASYTSTDPKVASDTVNAFVDIYNQHRLAAAVAIYTNAIDSASTQIQELTESEEALRQQIATASDIDQAALKPELTSVQTRKRQLSTEKAQSESKQVALERTPPAAVLATAEPPSSPLGIPRSFILFGGLVVGAVSGIVAAFVLERLDTTARDESDVALALGTSVMGSVPLLGFRQRSGPSSLVMTFTGGSNRVSAAREAFRRLRSSMQYLNASADISTILVTSSAPGEGKSLTSANLSVSLAQNGSRVVLISGDMRRPSLERLFGVESPRPGLAEYLNNTAELAIDQVPNVENLWLVRSGQPPGNPGELLSSNRFEQMIKELKANHVDYIIVDTPPVLSTADAVSAARHVDGVLVVVDTQRTETSDLLQVRSDLERSGSKLLGAVMNRQRFKRDGLFKRKKYAYYEAEASRAAQQPSGVALTSPVRRT